MSGIRISPNALMPPGPKLPPEVIHELSQDQLVAALGCEVLSSGFNWPGRC
jgi:hypothetical protein